MPVPRSDPAVRQPPGARRAALLGLLRDSPGPLSVAELAAAVGLHQNTVRAHLDVLVRTGRVVRRTEPRRTPGRPREVYEATGAPDGDRNYQLLAQVLATRLAELSPDPAGAAVEAGRRWVEHAAAPAGDGNRAPSPPADVADVGTPGPVTDGAAPPSAGPLAPVLRTLRTAGFAPELSADGSRIDLHHCPFLEVAREHPDVVCGAHLGLIQGELARLGSPATATRLVPFERPGVCSAHLAVHLAVPLESRERAQ